MTKSKPKFKSLIMITLITLAAACAAVSVIILGVAAFSH